MASTAFKVVSWSPLDPITKDKLDAMVSNDNFLKDNMISGQYSRGSINRRTGLRVLTGIMPVPSHPKSGSYDKVVNLGTFFSQNCMPMITTGIYSQHHRKVFVTIDGPGNVKYPTSSSFAMHVRVEGAKAGAKINRKPFDIVWVAVGY